MKITVKETKAPAAAIKYEDLPDYTVFRYDCGVTGMKLPHSDGILLAKSDGSPWFDTIYGYKTKPIAEVFGILKEIIVEKEV